MDHFQRAIVPPMDFWNSLAVMYRNSRGIGAALFLFIAIIAMQWQRCNPMELRENISCTVVQIEAEGLQSPGFPELQSRVLVSTPDSVKVRLLLPPPVPMVGDLIPIVAEHYKKGDTLYFLDRQQWLMDGPQ